MSDAFYLDVGCGLLMYGIIMAVCLVYDYRRRRRRP